MSASVYNQNKVIILTQFDSREAAGWLDLSCVTEGFYRQTSGRFGQIYHKELLHTNYTFDITSSEATTVSVKFDKDKIKFKLAVSPCTNWQPFCANKNNS